MTLALRDMEKCAFAGITVMALKTFYMTRQVARQKPPTISFLFEFWNRTSINQGQTQGKTS